MDGVVVQGAAQGTGGALRKVADITVTVSLAALMTAGLGLAAPRVGNRDVHESSLRAGVCGVLEDNGIGLADGAWRGQGAVGEVGVDRKRSARGETGERGVLAWHLSKGGTIATEQGYAPQSSSAGLEQSLRSQQTCSLRPQ